MTKPDTPPRSSPPLTARELRRSAISAVLLILAMAGCGGAGTSKSPAAPASPPATSPPAAAPPSAPPTAGANSLERVKSDMQAPHEATPDGAGSFYWSSGPAVRDASGSGFAALGGFGQVMLPQGSPGAGNVRVQLRNFETFVLLASTDSWRRVQYSERVIGNFYPVGYPSRLATPGGARNESDGGTSIRPAQGQVYRFWPESGMTQSLLQITDVKAIWTTVQARLVSDSPGAVDDRAGAQVLVNTAAQWATDLTDPAAAFPLDQSAQVGQGRLRRVTSQWQALNFTSASNAQLDTTPVPLVNSANGGTAKALRILPIGDSITAGSPRQPSYRRVLWNLMVGDPALRRVDLVGSRNGVNLNGGTCASPVGLPPDSEGRPVLAEFDQDHDAYWGWCTDLVRQRLALVLPNVQPDVALVHLGTNDLGGKPSAQIATEFGMLVAGLRARNPDIRVLIAQLIPFSGDNAARVDLNQRIASLAQSLSTASSPVLAVDQDSGFVAATDTYDGLHPNDAGEVKMADRWLQALRSFW